MKASSSDFNPIHGLEQLENRTVPTVAAIGLNPLDGVLGIVSNETPTSVRVEYNTVGSGAAQIEQVKIIQGANQVIGTYLSGMVRQIRFVGGLRNDVFNASLFRNPVPPDGGFGNDILIGGRSTNTILGGFGNDNIQGAGPGTYQGQAGDDRITTGGGNDTIDGGEGNDTIVSQGGNDNVSGGTGNDSIRTGGGADVVNGGDGNDTIYTYGGRDNIHGGAGDDTIYGGDEMDWIQGDEGNDTINGEGGDDSLGGGADNDRISGGLGNDSIGGGDGIDTITGDEGNDAIGGGIGNDDIFGGPGVDNIRGDDGNDTLRGGEGNDTIAGGLGNDHINGNNGIDTLNGEQDNDNILGEDGNDIINGGTGDDVLSGGANEDRIDGGEGLDVINGGDGNDVINGDRGRNEIDGGNGNDTIRGGPDDERIYGGLGNDTINGNSGTDTIYGNGGNDTINGGYGVDTIYGGEGNDNIDGSYDADTINGDEGDDTITGDDGDDTLNGNDGTDIIYGDSGGDTISGGLGNDTIKGGSGIDLIGGGEGNDKIDGGTYDDAIYGEGGADFLLGGGGYDTIYGGPGNDNINGGEGVDRLYGGEGDDWIIAIDDQYYDHLTGDAGRDIFWRDKDPRPAPVGTEGDRLEDLTNEDADQAVAAFVNVGADRVLDGDRIPGPAFPAVLATKTFTTNPLFSSNGPKGTDINQGAVGDCKVVSALAALARDNGPGNSWAIRKNMVDFGDGTYGMNLGGTFYRLDNVLPLSQGSQTRPNYANLGPEDSLWIAIAEKGIAMADPRTPGVFQYSDLSSTGADEVFRFFGSAQTGVPFLNSRLPGGYANANALGTDILQRFTAPQPQYITVSFGDSFDEVVGPPRVPGTLGRKFITNHAYTLWALNLNAQGQIASLVLRNPWGTDKSNFRVTYSDGNPNDGLVTVTLAELFSSKGRLNWASRVV